MGGCEGCSLTQCIMADKKDCLLVPGNSRKEDKCVSNTCTNAEDCRKLFVNSRWGWGDNFECKNGTCELIEDRV